MTPRTAAALLLLCCSALLLLPLGTAQDPHGALGGMYLYSNDDPWDVPQGAPIKGVLQKVKWPEIEPSPGLWNFTGFDAECAAGGQHGAIHLVFNTYAVPEWLYSAGVKKVKVLTDKGIEPFPHYTDPAYLQHVALVQKHLCQHIDAMPSAIRPFEIFFDAGPTGDSKNTSSLPFPVIQSLIYLDTEIAYVYSDAVGRGAGQPRSEHHGGSVPRSVSTQPAN